MNFINSILLFFALLLIGPKLISEDQSKLNNAVILATEKKDPYAGTVLVRGGTFSMGLDEESVIADWNNNIRRVTVSAFRIDQYEVSNKKYRDYTNWVREVYKPSKNDSMYKTTLPDTLVWKSDLAYNEPMVEGYFRFKSFNDYPVVGVTWEQATAFCRWRTDRANESALRANGLIDAKTPYMGKTQIDYNLADSARKAKPTKRASFKNLDDYVLIPDFRLPTEAEWEYTAKLSSQKQGGPGENAPRSGPNSAHKGATLNPLDAPFPWASTGNENIRFSGNGRGKISGVTGMYKANFKNGAGDYMGMTGKANDGAALPSRVDSYNQSPFNIYNVRGNVNEWVMDLYRPMSNIDMDDFNPYRGNTVLDGDDGNISSYETGVNTLISNKSRVYKGGSWKDGIYWLNPGTRRFLDQDKSTSTIGFRCAISAFGMDNSKPMNSENGSGPLNWIKNLFKRN